MKKKILFVEHSLGMGGAEKSLLTILSMFEYSKYDVDLFLFRHNGEFMSMLPSEVNLLPECQNYRIFEKNKILAPFIFLKKGKFKLSFHCIAYLAESAFYKIRKKFYSGWNHIKYLFDDIETQYDVSIAFIERRPIYFNIDKVKSKNKIGFVHNDYSIYSYDYNLEKKYFESYNKIATVSEHCKEVLVDIFPEYKDKFLVIKNMISKNVITKMSNESIELEKNKNEIIIVTVGRLTFQKGIDNAVKICKKLVDNNYNVKWHVLGCGEEYDNLLKLIKDNKIENNFFLDGPQLNPYSWIKKCDIYVQPSRYEGFGITVAEAKCLAKPLVISDIPEFNEQIENNVNGYVAKDNNEMYNKIVDLIEHEEVRNAFSLKLKSDNFENINELKKLYEVMDG